MNKLLRALTLINEGKAQSLVCEVPRALLDDLEIGPDGQVDLSTLLAICKHLSTDFESNRSLMRLIYDQSIAVKGK